jgi:hypothetical protein
MTRSLLNRLLPKRKFTHPLIQPAEAGSSKFDEFVKSRHSGENRSPDDPQLLENTGFRLSPE